MLHSNQQRSSENHSSKSNDRRPIQGNAEKFCFWRKLKQAVHDIRSNIWSSEELGKCRGLLRPVTSLQSATKTLRNFWGQPVQRPQRTDPERISSSVKSVNRLQMR